MSSSSVAQAAESGSPAQAAESGSPAQGAESGTGGAAVRPSIVLDVATAAAANLDRPRSTIEDHGGTLASSRDGGLTATFALDRAHDAINAAIVVQELRKLAATVRQPRLGIGLASGAVRRQADGGVAGKAADRARLLAVTANDGAILVDVETLSASDNERLRSVIGDADGRSASGYVSDQGWLPGAEQSIRYHEIVWDLSTRGLRPDALLTGGIGAAVVDWKVGRLRSWNAARQHGFIVADDGEFFYVDDRFLACDDVPAVGAEVWFRPRPSLIEGKNRVAAMVVAVGSVTGVSIDREHTHIHDPAGNTGTLAYVGTGSETGERSTRISTQRGRPVVK